MSEHEMIGESGFAKVRKGMNLLPFGAERPGQSCPKSCPQHCPHSENGESGQLLGEPLSIREVAGLIGCSVWTVRQRYLPAALPHLRLRPNGKLIFYQNQVVHWLLTEQRKGGPLL